MQWPWSTPDGGIGVKICGLRRPEDLRAAAEAGADLIGLVFAPSRRQVDAETARALLASTAAPPAIGVFVDTSPEEVNAIAERVGLAAAQLSGHETPPEAGRLAMPYIKAIQLREGASAEAILHIMNEYREAAAFLLDSPSTQGGGSGVACDWGLAAEIVRLADRPVLLAGGLNPGNVCEAIRQTGARWVDVSSGVERDGWKDPGLIRDFVAAAKALHGSSAGIPAGAAGIEMERQ